MVRPSAALSLQLPEPDPGVHRLLAGAGNLAQRDALIQGSWVLSQRNPVANGIDLSLLKSVSPIEWDNILLYGQYNPDWKLVRRRRAP